MKTLPYKLPIAAMLFTLMGLFISADSLMAQGRGNGAACEPYGDRYNQYDRGPRGYGYPTEYRDRDRGRREFVRNIPRSARRHKVGRDTYFSHRGVYYLQTRRGYRVVPAPMGLRVRNLPRGSRMIETGRRPVFVARGTYFRYVPRYDVYEVVRAPRGNQNDSRGRGRNSGRNDDYSYDDRRPYRGR